VAEDVVEQSIALPRAEAPPLVEPVRAPEHPRVYRWRFAVAYLALAVLAGAGVGVAVMLLDRPDDRAGPAWSDWKPVGHQASYPDQIADFVGEAYRNTNGRQLAGVVASAPRVSNQTDFVPVQNLFIQNESALPSASPDVDVVGVGDSVMYVLCGFGLQCSIAEGEATPERLMLLRREALELALYTFRYVDGAESAIVVLPTELGQNAEDPADDQRFALYLEKKNFERELARPVSATLPLATPPQASALDERETRTVERLTDPSIFQYEFQQAQTGGAVMILAPINARP
jgi:hypothetical protein